MSNLSDLLPAGAAAKQLTFTDSGSGIATKKPVILNSDGTVTEVGSTTTSAGLGAKAVFESSDSGYMDIAYDTANSRVCVIYRDDGGTTYAKACVGSISGKTITWGTPTTFESADTYSKAICYDTNSGKMLVVFKHSSDGNGHGIVGTIDAASNSISFGSEAVFASGGADKLNLAYDANAQKSVIVYRDNGNSSYGTGIVATISGTSVSYGSSAVFDSTSITQTAISYDSSAQKVVVGFTDSSNNGKGVVGTVSGTSISFGSSTSYTSGQGYDIGSAYDTSADKTVFLFRQGPANVGAAVVGTVSGTSISFGTVNSFETAPLYYPAPVYDSNLGKVVCVYSDSSTNLVLRIATISGTSISMSGETEISSSYSPDSCATYASDAGVSVIAFEDGSNSYYGTGICYAGADYPVTNLTATNFVGVTDSAISASAAGSVIVQGGTVTGVASGTGISLGTAVEVAVANSQPESITYDTNANKTVLAYQDAGSSYHGYAAVGTVSGTSISFGTPVLINAGAHYYGSSCYDSTNNKVILVYTDGSNSNYLTAIVGTVSGTSISFGSPAVVSSQNYVDWAACAYDTNEQKVVVAYKDKGNSNYGTGVVGTVSGTSISFGSSTAFNSSDSTPAMAVYDSNAQKVVIDYWDTGNSYYGTAVVGTVSGTSISFGSPVVYNAAQVTNLGGCFDSTNNKVVITYLDTGNSNYGTALVGTVSGTSISFGSEAVFVTQQAGWNRCAYDTNAQKVIVSTANATDTSGQLYTGTVSGTDISFGTAVTFDSDGTSQNAITYDSSSNQIVLAYQAYSDSYKAKAVVGSFGDLPLTVGAKYYVTTSGGFSSSADTPSVNAGLALSTTSLLLNGDS